MKVFQLFKQLQICVIVQRRDMLVFKSRKLWIAIAFSALVIGDVQRIHQKSKRMMNQL